MSGVKSGVNGTPTFFITFINGIRYDGYWDEKNLVAELEETLAHYRLDDFPLYLAHQTTLGSLSFPIITEPSESSYGPHHHRNRAHDPRDPQVD